ncbi:MAG: molecular chaperone TorD family protein [Deltaproteobacteria bacterium]|nr:molecular chaperone TorD family protein [Deltaproteobacteria bacterium]MBW2360725.1 molecular chaperone TorD family protein [Deltaproteobacteria bacterium]
MAKAPTDAAGSRQDPRPGAPDSGRELASATAHSRVYALFARALSYPDDEFCRWIAEGGLVEPLREQLAVIEPALAKDESVDWEALRNAGSADDLAVEYTRLFDAGASGPPCPLYGGLYVGARMKTMEEAVRFYNHFGLTLSDEQRELPDHLVTQLEFLHFLGYREAEALEQGADPGPYRRAQRDFVARHPGAWLPRLCEKLLEQGAAPFFGALLAALNRLLAAESKRLAATP